jgi:hypothetical protein
MLQIPIVATTRRMRMKAAQLELTTSIGDIAEKQEAGAEKGKGKNGK